MTAPTSTEYENLVYGARLAGVCMFHLASQQSHMADVVDSVKVCRR